jgi:hypothetical protein
VVSPCRLAQLLESNVVKKYDYQGDARAVTSASQGSGIVLVLFATVGAVNILLLGLRESAWRWPAILLSVLVLVVGWVGGLMQINMYPTMWIGDKHLVISFNRARVNIPWEDVVDVSPASPSWFLREWCFAVQARKITRFHFLYTPYGEHFRPTFLIHREIQDREELLSEIKRRMEEARSAPSLL